MKFKVKEETGLLNFLFSACEGMSRTAVRENLKNGRIYVNGEKKTAFDLPLNAGDEVEIVAKRIALGEKMEREAAEKVGKLGLRIVYEDEHLIIVDKPSGLPSVSTGKAADKSRETGVFGGRERTAYTILTDYMHKQVKAEHLATGEYSRKGRVWVVHRLDKGTSGLLMFAKDERTKDLMQSKWEELVLERKYVALIEGRPEQDEGTVTSYLSENPKSLKMVSSETKTPDSHKAVTHYRITDDNGKYCKAEFELETGRKNQIRVHCAEVLETPVAGDKKYGAQSNPLRRLALHAGTLVLRNPYGGRIIRLQSELPSAFSKVKFGK